MATLGYILQNLDSSKPYQSFRAILDDNTYEMLWQWNARGEFWTCAIGEVGADPIIKYKVTANSDPLEVYGYREDLPQGSLIVFSLYQPRNRVTLESIGQDNLHWLVYISDE